MKYHIKNLFNKSQKNLKKIQKKIKELGKMEDYEKIRKNPTKTPSKPKAPEKVIVHLSMASVAKATLIIIALYLLAQFAYEIKDILLILFVAILFSTAIDHTVNSLQKRKIPRAVSVLFIYLVLLFVVVFFISNLIPIVAEQLLELAKQADEMVSNLLQGKSFEDMPFAEKLAPYLHSVLEGIDQQTVVDNIKVALEKLGEQLQNVAGNTWAALKVVFNSLFNMVLVLVITFFLVTDKTGLDKFIMSLFPSRYNKYILEKTEAIKDKIGHWLRGIITLMVCMFLLYLIGFSILGIKYATTLAIMGGIAELFPVIGPILAGIPAVLIAFNQSPWLVLWVLGLMVLIQQIEGNIFIPIIMKKAVGLSPVIIIISVLIGYELLGLLGIILAVPVATTISIFITDYISKDK